MIIQSTFREVRGRGPELMEKARSGTDREEEVGEESRSSGLPSRSYLELSGRGWGRGVEITRYTRKQALGSSPLGNHFRNINNYSFVLQLFLRPFEGKNHQVKEIGVGWKIDITNFHLTPPAQLFPPSLPFLFNISNVRSITLE